MAPSSPDELDITPHVLWALAEETTRLALYYLHDANSREIPLDELAEQVSKDHSGAVHFAQDRAEVHLHHVSLPQLDEFGLIDYDPEAQVVRNYAEYRLPHDLEEFLQGLDDR